MGPVVFAFPDGFCYAFASTRFFFGSPNPPDGGEGDSFGGYTMNDWYSEEELRALYEELKVKLETEFGKEGIVVLWTAQNMMRLANGETTSALLKDGHQLYVVFSSEDLRAPDEPIANHRSAAIALECGAFMNDHDWLTGLGGVKFKREKDAYGVPLYFIGLTSAA